MMDTVPLPEPNLLWRMLTDMQQNILAAVADAASHAGGAANLVGGPVRDLLRGTTDLHDLDVATTTDAIEIAERIAADNALAMNARVTQTTEFGTATIVLMSAPDRHPISLDIATARAETYLHPGALPVVQYPVSITDDLSRRDFTINAMVLPIMCAGFGDLRDPHGGLSDLRAGLIRVLHDESFRDDPTRLFRALRYAARFDFTLETQTSLLARHAVENGALMTISPHRKRHELDLAFLERDSVKTLAAFATLGLLRATSPALIWDDSIAHRLALLLPRLRQDALADEASSATGKQGDAFAVFWPVWAAFVIDQDRAALDRLFADIPMTATMQRSIRQLVAAYQRRDAINNTMPLSQLAALFAGVPYWVIPFFFDEAFTARIAQMEAREKQINRQDRTEKRFSGNDLDRLGIPRDRRRRQILDALRSARWDGAVETVEDEAAFVVQFIAKHNSST